MATPPLSPEAPTLTQRTHLRRVEIAFRLDATGEVWALKYDHLRELVAFEVENEDGSSDHLYVPVEVLRVLREAIGGLVFG